MPIGTIARHTAADWFSCIPSATANNQPIPGLIPWNAPRNSSIAHELVIALREAIRVGRGVAAFEMDLARTQRARVEVKLRIERAAVRLRIDLCVPSAHAIGIELLVP